MDTLLPGMSAERVPTSRLTVNTLSVAEREDHAGPAVLFVHGNVSSSLFWQPTMLALPEPFRPLAIDLRGFGDTDDEPIDATRGLRDFSDDLAAAIEALHEDAVHLVGWGMGGGVVLQYLVDRPGAHRVASLTLVAPVSPFGFGGTKGVDGMLCDPWGAGSGGGGANPEFVERLAGKDRTDKDDMLRPACGWLSWQSEPVRIGGTSPAQAHHVVSRTNRSRSMRRSLMPIVGGMDIHRKQITFDYLDLVTGEVQRGQIVPADRAHLRAWLGRFAGVPDVAFAFEACTGWRYVAGELARAGIEAHLAEPADTAAARGRKKRAKTDRADSKLMRELLAQGRLPECWIPPEQVLECRALLETYHALRREHTAWVQRAHAVLFHQGATRLREGGTGTAEGRELLREIAAGQLSPAGQQQIGLYLRMLEVTEA